MNYQPSGVVVKNGKIIYTEIQIDAPVSRVWACLRNFEAYPDWNPFVKTISGNPQVGETLQVDLQQPGKKPMRFRPQVLVCIEEKELRWLGSMGLPRIFDGEHVFHLLEEPDGTCRFIQYECFRGMLVPFLNKMLEHDTRAGFEQMNRALKERCER